MRGSSLKVTLLQISPPKRRLHQRVVRLRLLQLTEDFEIGRNVFRLVLRQLSVSRQQGQQWRRNSLPAQGRD